MSRESVTETTVSPNWLSYSEAQIYTGLGRTTLWKISNTANSGIVVAKVGSAVRFERNSLDRYMRRCAKD